MGKVMNGIQVQVGDVVVVVDAGAQREQTLLFFNLRVLGGEVIGQGLALQLHLADLGVRGLESLGLGWLFHPETLDGPDHADESAGPPGKNGVPALKTLGVQQASHRRAKRSAQAGGGGGRAVDGTEDLRGGSGIGEEDGSCGEGDDMESDLADQGNVYSRHLEFSRKEDEIWHCQVERRPGEQHEAERAQGSEMLDDEWEQPQLGNHRVHTLDGEHETNRLCRETEAASELEWQGHLVVGFGGAQKHGHQLIK